MKWKKQEKDLLINSYKTNGLSWCCKELNKSKSSVSLMAKSLNISHKSTDKRINDDIFLIENYLKFGADYCAEKLNRNKKQIIKRASALRLKPKKIWTKEEEVFLIENYKNKGSEYCGNKLNIENTKITLKANKLGLTLSDDASKERKRRVMLNLTDNRYYSTYNVNPDLFFKIKKPEIAYLLGFIWADGHIRKNKNVNAIKLDISTRDIYDIKKIFDAVGKWNYYDYVRDGKYKISTITTNNRPIVEFLIKNDYLIKSIKSPVKILNHIPEKLKHYFFRGWSDGDGCFYKGEKNNSFSICSTYECDWSLFVKQLKDINIESKSKKVINKKGQKNSQIIISKKESIIKWGNYIYKNFKNDNIGLMRKYKKFLLIKNN